MVVSKIIKNVNYSEHKKLDSEDIEHNATTFDIELYDVDVVIAIGKEKYTFIEKGIVYFPIYLIKDDLVYNQIGLYEIKGDDLISVIDDDGDLNLELIDEPLLYSFVNKKYLLKILKPDETKEDNVNLDESKNIDKKIEDEQSDDSDDPDNPDTKKDEETKLSINKESIESLTNDNDDKNIFEHDKSINIEELKEINDVEENISENSPWIQKYMKNSNFSIQDNEGGGDCLFAVIRDAFNSIGKKTTVNKLRDLLASNADDETFYNYKQHFDMYEESFNESKDVMNQLETKQKTLKKELNKTKNRKRQLDIIDEGKDNLERYNKLKEEIKTTQELKNEFEFMRGVTNLEDFKAKIKTCEFWAETWAISTLERALNIKLIILSHENFIQGDEDNVILCGQLNDNVLEKKKSFNPDYYIITDYNGSHYKLIKYKNRSILKQNEIPNKLKKNIIEKCCENENGPFSIIDGFKTKVEKTPDKSEVVEPIHQNIYDDSTTFQFYEKSSSKPYPGKGNGESIDETKIKLFNELNKTKDWRRMLSDKWENKFTFDSHDWLTTEHCVQAIKFKQDNDLDSYEKFSLNSDSELSNSVDLISKNQKNKEPIDDEVYEAILLSKFSQSDKLKTILINTNDALLTTYIRGKPAKKNIALMNVRKKLSSQ